MRSLIYLGAIVWLSAAISGVIYITRYKNTPAAANVTYPAVFPRQSRLELDPGRPTLMFFAHPKCPCTRASLRELSRLMSETTGKLKAYVIFIKPKNEDDEWVNTDLRNLAEAIPGVEVLIDEEEKETKIFNAQTSSLTLLYDRSGALRFDGGITASRGHEGDNAGRAAIFKIVTADAAPTTETPVFGCPLRQKDCPGELMSVPE
jgi:hypothetical protein